MVIITFNDLRTALSPLELARTPVIAHASLRAFGNVDGGGETLIRAVLDSVGGLGMPTFTYQSMVIPETGPPNNGITYGSELSLNRMAEPFPPDLSADMQIGTVPEVLRPTPRAQR